MVSEDTFEFSCPIPHGPNMHTQVLISWCWSDRKWVPEQVCFQCYAFFFLIFFLFFPLFLKQKDLEFLKLTIQTGKLKDIEGICTVHFCIWTHEASTSPSWIHSLVVLKPVPLQSHSLNFSKTGSYSLNYTRISSFKLNIVNSISSEL